MTDPWPERQEAIDMATALKKAEKDGWVGKFARGVYRQLQVGRPLSDVQMAHLRRLYGYLKK